VLSLGEDEARALAETIQTFGAAVKELPNEPEVNPAPLGT
jgi:NADH dehydrogenase